jgi:hypothetical protein
LPNPYCCRNGWLENTACSRGVTDYYNNFYVFLGFSLS